MKQPSLCVSRQNLASEEATICLSKSSFITKSSKSAVLTLLKHSAPIETVSKDLKIPRQTHYDWKKAAMASTQYICMNFCGKPCSFRKNYFFHFQGGGSRPNVEFSTFFNPSLIVNILMYKMPDNVLIVCESAKENKV